MTLRSEEGRLTVGSTADIDTLKTKMEEQFKVPVENLEFLDGEAWRPLKDVKQLLAKPTRVRIPVDYAAAKDSGETHGGSGNGSSGREVDGSQEDISEDARSFKLLVILPKAQEQLQVRAHDLDEFLSVLRNRVPLEGEIKAVEVPNSEDNWSVLQNISQLPKDVTKIRLQVGPAAASPAAKRSFILAVKNSRTAQVRRMEPQVATLAELREFLRMKLNMDIATIQYSTSEDENLRTLENLNDLPQKARILVTERRTRVQQRYASPPKNGGGSSPPQASLSSSPASLSLSPASSAYSSPPSSIPPPSPLISVALPIPKQLAPQVSLGPSLSGGQQHTLSDKPARSVQQTVEKPGIFSQYETARQKQQQAPKVAGGGLQANKEQAQAQTHGPTPPQQVQQRSQQQQTQLHLQQQHQLQLQQDKHDNRPSSIELKIVTNGAPKPPAKTGSSITPKASVAGLINIAALSAMSKKNSGGLYLLVQRGEQMQSETLSLKQLWTSDWVQFRIRPVFFGNEIVVEAVGLNVRLRSMKSLSFLPAKIGAAVYLSEEDVPCFVEQNNGEKVCFIGFDKKGCEEAQMWRRSLKSEERRR